MYYFTYLLGSYYVIRSIFRFSDYTSKYLIENDYIDLPISKKEKLDECIYSSFHSLLSSFFACLSLTTPILKDPYNPFDMTIVSYPQNNQLQLFTTCFSLSYFLMDLSKCIYHKKYMFIMHHLAAIHLLYSGLQSFGVHDNKGFYIMYFIFLLESNTVLLNIGYILKECNFHYSITCLSWIIHLFFFITFRLITIPKLIVMYYLYEGITMKTLLELPSFLLIMAGSTYWSYTQLKGIRKYLKNCIKDIQKE